MKMNKLIAVILSVVMTASCGLGIVASAADGSCDCGLTPVVNVLGVASRNIVTNPGAEDEQALFPPSADQVLASFSPELLLDIGGFAATRDWKYMASALAGYFNVLFGGVGGDDDGVMAEDSGIDWEYPTNASHSYGRDFDFCYDWRKDPYIIAAELNDYINYICELTGHEKVDICAFSMGSIVTMTYISVYGDEKIEDICFSAPAYNGVSCCGEPFASKIEVVPVALMRYVDTFVGEDGTGLMVNSVIEILGMVGIVNGISGALDTTVENVLPLIYDEVFLKSFLTMPGLWSLVPDEYYELAKQEHLLPEAERYATLIEKIDAYHYGVQVNISDMLEEMQASGEHNITSVVKYGNQTAPVVESWDNLADGVIDTKYSSFGATCSTLDGTLAEDYVQAVDDGHNHISPDRQIDASTCLLADNTWFVKGLVHMNNPKAYDNIIFGLLASDVLPTVFDDADLPQFLSFSEKTESISHLTENEEAPEQSPEDFLEGINPWFATLYRFIIAIFSFFKQLLNK